LLLLVVTLILVTTFLSSTHHSFIGVILSLNSQQISFRISIIWSRSPFELKKNEYLLARFLYVSFQMLNEVMSNQS